MPTSGWLKVFRPNGSKLAHPRDRQRYRLGVEQEGAPTRMGGGGGKEIPPVFIVDANKVRGDDRPTGKHAHASPTVFGSAVRTRANRHRGPSGRWRCQRGRGRLTGGGRGRERERAGSAHSRLAPPQRNLLSTLDAGAAGDRPSRLVGTRPPSDLARGSSLRRARHGRGPQVEGSIRNQRRGWL